METVRELLAKKGKAVHSVHPTATMFEALKLMAEKNVGAVVVADEEGRLHGIFSERDFARKMIVEGSNMRTIKVTEVMTTMVVSVNPDTLINESMALMTEKRIRHLPVLEDGKLTGIVSIGDVVKSMLSEQETMISQQAYKIDQLEIYTGLRVRFQKGIIRL
jgi:CBS domain-containing protein